MLEHLVVTSSRLHDPHFVKWVNSKPTSPPSRDAFDNVLRLDIRIEGSEREPEEAKLLKKDLLTASRLAGRAIGADLRKASDVDRLLTAVADLAGGGA